MLLLLFAGAQVIVRSLGNVDGGFLEPAEMLTAASPALLEPREMLSAHDFLYEERQML